eukprot:g462.t1
MHYKQQHPKKVKSTVHRGSGLCSSRSSMKAILVYALFWCARIVSASKENVDWQNVSLVWSSTGPDAVLPHFLFMAGIEEDGKDTHIFDGFNYTGGTGEPNPYEPGISCPDTVFENTSPDLRTPTLPWAIQYDWGCERIKKNVSMLALENDVLKAYIAPQWGGRVWSLYNKKEGRELFFKNPAHQPANIAYRKAWAAGGAEWNWSPGRIGHSAFSESPVHTAVMNSDLGKVIRVWEYDRLNGTVWQVDMLIDLDGVFWIHPKISNPTNGTIPSYWWTCVAMSVDHPDGLTRIVAPSTLSINEQCAPWPHGGIEQRNSTFRGPDLSNCARDNTCVWQQDMSILGNIDQNYDFFMHIENREVPYITHVQPDGWALIHAHPSWLNGTKFFTWSFAEHGTYQQDFLSAAVQPESCNPNAYDPNCKDFEHSLGAYTELQVGPAITQFHNFRIAERTSMEWTEWFKGWQGNKDELFSPRYDEAVDAVDRWMQSADGMTRSRIEQVDAVFKSIADVVPKKEDVVYGGMPWGGLQEMLLKHRGLLPMGSSLAPGAPFPRPDRLDPRTRPWVELLEDGMFSNETLASTPINFEVSDLWIEVLHESLESNGATWLHYLYLGTHALEVGNAADAKTLLKNSMALKGNAHAARALAFLAESLNDAIEMYSESWSLALDALRRADDEGDDGAKQLGVDLSSEYAGWLMGNEQWLLLREFLASLASASEPIRSYLKKDRVLHAQAALAVHNGDFEAAIRILRDNCFPTYGALRQMLIELWHEAQLQKAVKNKGSALSKAELINLRREFRCYGDSTESTLKDPCICGPPNLGYAYP